MLLNIIFRSETNKVRHLQYVRGLILGPFFVSAKLIALAIFMAYSLVDGHMTAVYVFMTLALFHAIKTGTTLFMPLAITFGMETRVTLDRIKVCICWRL